MHLIGYLGSVANLLVGVGPSRRIFAFALWNPVGGKLTATTSSNECWDGPDTNKPRETLKRACDQYPEGFHCENASNFNWKFNTTTHCEIIVGIQLRIRQRRQGPRS
jgi:hypothetical protein